MAARRSRAARKYMARGTSGRSDLAFQPAYGSANAVTGLPRRRPVLQICCGRRIAGLEREHGRFGLDSPVPARGAIRVGPPIPVPGNAPVEPLLVVRLHLVPA